jgi:hypothetical protein
VAAGRCEPMAHRRHGRRQPGVLQRIGGPVFSGLAALHGVYSRPFVGPDTARRLSCPTVPMPGTCSGSCETERGPSCRLRDVSFFSSRSLVSCVQSDK